MKRYPVLVAVLILLVAGLMVSESAMARGGRGGHGGGHSYGARIGVGIALGAPIYGLGYYSAPYYSYPYAYPAYAYPAPAYAYPGPAMAPAQYVQQGAPQAAPAPQQDWFFCPNSNAYYPYVRECPSGWQRVPSQPQR